MEISDNLVTHIETKCAKKLDLDSHFQPCWYWISLVHLVLDGVDDAYDQVVSVVPSIRTCFEYAALASCSDHTALDQSRKNHDSTLSRSHIFCWDQESKVCPANRKHKDPLSMASIYL